MNNIENIFVPYQIALDMRSIGFDEPCCQAYYTNGENELSPFYSNPNVVDEWLEKLPLIKAPLYQQAFRWFREKYPELDFAVGKIYNGTNNYHYHINLLWEYFEGTYEEAELACLVELIEIIKNKQDDKN